MPDVPDPSPDSEPSARAVSRVTTHWGLILGVAAAVLVADQLSKWWVVDNLRTRSIAVFWTLRLQLTGNTGAAFSLAGSRGRLIGLGVIAIIGAVLWFGRTMSSKFGAVALGLVLGGALGNLVDRATRGDAGFLQGAVVDFIDFQWFPVFNVADMGIVVGGILLAASLLLTGAGASGE